ncbi:hypothetical protein BDN70DRAFT_882470 [Pholiota conissans]|uniref:Uncharacterized protein n=1 Tax=Pholiota conissans TaxID=109636 RepID=A0A9P6CXL8_9AGAR|nr:hypothetical protein BDN70DRAFT_882470 [Pholiota conissans]
MPSLAPRAHASRAQCSVSAPSSNALQHAPRGPAVSHTHLNTALPFNRLPSAHPTPCTLSVDCGTRLELELES